MIAAANAYFDMFFDPQGTVVPFATPCNRWENGTRTTQGDCSNMGPAGAGGMEMTHRRFPIVDLEAGIVVGFVLFADSLLYPEVAPTESRIGDLLDVRPGDLAGFDAVMHLAGISNDAMGMLNPELTWRVNFEGTMHGARCAKAAGVPLFLQSSSCSVYGKTDDRPIAEDGQTAPITVYAESKIRVEEELPKLADSGFSPVYLRNATAFGSSPPGFRPRGAR